MPESKKCIIIGGGLAGVAAAYWCAEQNCSQTVTLLEKEATLLGWLHRKGLDRPILGSTNFDEIPDGSTFPRGWPHVEGLLARWSGRVCREWLLSLGIDLWSDSSGKYGVSDGPQLIEPLQATLEKVGVEIKTGYAVESISRQSDGTFRIWSRDGSPESCHRLLLATGGERNHGLALAREFGMEIEPPVPGFVRLRWAGSRLIDQMGQTERSIGLRCPRSGLSAAGDVTMSARGLEGEAVSGLSAQLCLDWKQRDYRVPLEIDWIPGDGASAIRSELSSRVQAGRRKLVCDDPLFGFSQRQWAGLLSLSRIDVETPWIRLKTRKLQSLVQNLKACRATFQGMGLPAGERAWAGGVSLEAVNLATGESRGAPGLHFAGEILDYLGLPGGAHLNAVWASGYVGGSAMALPA